MTGAAPRPPSNRFTYVTAFIAAVGGLLFGYDTGVISGAILFVRQEFGLSTVAVGLVVSSVLWGALLGSAAGGGRPAGGQVRPAAGAQRRFTRAN